jgi:farnesyl diphosphate synthase
MPEPATPDARLAQWRARVESTLAAALPAIDAPPRRLHAAMRHATLNGGKRMRPLLVYATGTAFGCDATALDHAAAAVELVHAYSLVHDDLPAMDDDALRRGKPTVHVAFDEATAILAGDALQSLAFELLAQAPLPADARVAMLHELAVAAGARGMCGGQALDIDATGQKWGQSEFRPDDLPAIVPSTAKLHSDPISALERLHALKTGALLRASVRLGALAAAVDAEAQGRLDRFADALGLAFQIRDDLLDIEGDSATLGKTAGKDAAQDKATFPALLGVDASRARLRELPAAMQEALAPFGGRTDALAALGREAIERDR